MALLVHRLHPGSSSVQNSHVKLANLRVFYGERERMMIKFPFLSLNFNADKTYDISFTG